MSKVSSAAPQLVLDWEKTVLFFKLKHRASNKMRTRCYQTDQATLSFFHYQGRAKANLLYTLLKLSSHLNIIATLIATARFSQSQGIFKQTAKQTRTSISSFSREQTASRVLLDCGKNRSQEKRTITKSPLQYPKSAASLSDYPNHSAQRSKCSTDICKLHKKQFHSVTDQSERWLVRKAKAICSPPFSQHRISLAEWQDPKSMDDGAQPSTSNTNRGFSTPLCPSHSNVLQFKPSVLRSRGTESWVQQRDCLWIFYKMW